MTKAEIIEALKDVPDDEQIHICFKRHDSSHHDCVPIAALERMPTNESGWVYPWFRYRPDIPPKQHFIIWVWAFRRDW